MTASRQRLVWLDTLRAALLVCVVFYNVSSLFGGVGARHAVANLALLDGVAEHVVDGAMRSIAQIVFACFFAVSGVACFYSLRARATAIGGAGGSTEASLLLGVCTSRLQRLLVPFASALFVIALPATVIVTWLLPLPSSSFVSFAIYFAEMRVCSNLVVLPYYFALTVGVAPMLAEWALLWERERNDSGGRSGDGHLEDGTTISQPTPPLSPATTTTTTPDGATSTASAPEDAPKAALNVYWWYVVVAELLLLTQLSPLMSLPLAILAHARLRSTTATTAILLCAATSEATRNDLVSFLLPLSVTLLPYAALFVARTARVRLLALVSAVVVAVGVVAVPSRVDVNTRVALSLVLMASQHVAVYVLSYAVAALTEASTAADSAAAARQAPITPKHVASSHVHQSLQQQQQQQQHAHAKSPPPSSSQTYASGDTQTLLPALNTHSRRRFVAILLVFALVVAHPTVMQAQHADGLVVLLSGAMTTYVDHWPRALHAVGMWFGVVTLCALVRTISRPSAASLDLDDGGSGRSSAGRGERSRHDDITDVGGDGGAGGDSITFFEKCADAFHRHAFGVLLSHVAVVNVVAALLVHGGTQKMLPALPLFVALQALVPVLSVVLVVVITRQAPQVAASLGLAAASGTTWRSSTLPHRSES